MQELKSLKVHLVELLYSSIINKTFDNAVEYITKIVLHSDSIFNPLKAEFSLIAKIISLLLNSFLLIKANATFGEFVLNYVRIDTTDARILTQSKNKSKVILFIILNYVVPLMMDLAPKLMKIKFLKISNNNLNKIMKILRTIKTIKIGLDLFYKLSYLFKKKFLYYDFLDHLIGIMIVNQGSTEAFSDKFLNIGKQLNLFFLYMFMRFGEWFYKKEETSETIYEITPPANVNTNNSKCPICKNQITQSKSPTAMKCCGFVFCENCIVNHINTNSKCPSCLSQSDVTCLVKIYQ